jgi:signal transduction histidine kinase
MLIFAQQTRLQPEAIDIKRLVDDFFFENKCDRNIDVRLTHTDGLWRVLIDRQGLFECLHNLVLNAQEAMAEGGNLEIAIENTSHSVTDGLFLATELRPGRYVRLSIKDSGAGISNGLLSRIFDPFYTTKMVGAGIGLGLSMVLGFIRKSGGAIAVTSEINQGSTFHLYVPALADGFLATIDAY